SDASPTWQQMSVDDRAAHYMPWMALGGTEVQIPEPILQIISATKVLDQQRFVAASALSANMLSQAKALCRSLLGPGYVDWLHAPGNQPFFDPTDGHGYLDAYKTFLNSQLLFANGDAENWMRMCSIGNPPPVHVLPIDTGNPRVLDVPR